MDNERKFTWINNLLSEAVKHESAGIEMLHACGAKCAESSQFLEGAKKIRNVFPVNTNPDTIFEAFKSQYYNKSTFTKNGNKITLIFDECTCPMVKDGVNNPFLCNCTVGYTINVFTTLFFQEIDVKLIKSILRGDEICEQEILI